MTYHEHLALHGEMLTPFYDEFVLLQEQVNLIINVLLPRSAYVAGIRDNTTGEVRFSLWKEEWTEHSLFLWTGGDLGCDCQRHLIFHEKTRERYHDDVPCGSRRYTLVGIWLSNGGNILDLQKVEFNVL